jgi:polyisoprenoid-binding protein YceI
MILSGTVLSGSNAEGAAKGKWVRLMAWDVDLAHSSLEFAVRHMVVSTVKGTFSDFAVEAHVDDEDLTRSTGIVKVNVASLDTHEPRRDAHLRSADFFDVERFPTMAYAVKSVAQDGDEYRIVGDLTIRDITREVPLTAEVSGPVTDPFGGTRIGVSAVGKLNRHDYGLDWNVVTEAGGLLVGDDVKISVEAEFVQAQAPAETSEAGAVLETTSTS